MFIPRYDPHGEFIKLCKRILEETGKIDGDTPWQEKEPEWWLKMMELQRLARDCVPVRLVTFHSAGLRYFGFDSDHPTDEMKAKAKEAAEAFISTAKSCGFKEDMVPIDIGNAWAIDVSQLTIPVTVTVKEMQDLWTRYNIEVIS